MPRKRPAPRPLDTIWEVSDDLWARIEPILREDWQPSPKGGQPPKDWRPMVDGILHRLRSGCQWNHLPERFGSDRTIHRWFRRWCDSMRVNIGSRLHPGRVHRISSVYRARMRCS